MFTENQGLIQRSRAVNNGLYGKVKFNCNINIFNICFKSRIQSPNRRRLNIWRNFLGLDGVKALLYPMSYDAIQSERFDLNYKALEVSW